MAERRSFSPPPVGGSSLLVIFAVLCLTTFSLLSLSTVQADARLGDAAAQAVSGYYQADCQAETILAQLRQGQVPQGVTVDGDRYTYACPISDSQTLAVEVEVHGTSYTVLRWQATYSADWEFDDSLEVWNGETIP
jgi:hypothetical protein